MAYDGDDWVPALYDPPPPPRSTRRFVSSTTSRGGNALGPVVIVFVPASVGKERVRKAHERVFGRSPTRLGDWGEQFAVGLAVTNMERVESLITAFDTALQQVPA